MTTFSERLRKAMEEAHLTQAALAGMVDVCKSSVSGWYNGKVNPPEKVKERIALALGKPHNFFRVEEVNLEIAADGGYRLKPELAAKLMGISERTLKHGLQNGDFPWGYAILNPNTGTHTYWISRIRFSTETGIPVSLA